MGRVDTGRSKTESEGVFQVGLFFSFERVLCYCLVLPGKVGVTVPFISRNLSEKVWDDSGYPRSDLAIRYQRQTLLFYEGFVGNVMSPERLREETLYD